MAIDFMISAKFTKKTTTLSMLYIIRALPLKFTTDGGWGTPEIFTSGGGWSL